MRHDEPDKDLFERCLNKYRDLPSVALIRSVELKLFPREFLKEPILDLCCGDGFFTDCLGLKGVSGCDIDGNALKQAQSLNGTYGYVCSDDARKLSKFGDRAFSTVFSNCALEHVDGIDAALGSVCRVLKTNGHLVMTVPAEHLNEWFFPTAFLMAIGFEKYGRRLLKEYNKKQNHLNIYPLETWKQKLEEHNLKIVKFFYLFRKDEYTKVTFFESFALDSFPGTFFKKMYRLWKRIMALETRMAVWRKIMKPVYDNAVELKSGGELVIVARKMEEIF
jgi:SAM-dependent methyltransferase